MTGTMKKALWAASMLLLPASALAFVPQGPHLVELMVQAIKQPAGMVVYQDVKQVNHDNPDQAVTVTQVRLRYLFPGNFRSDTVKGPVLEICIHSNGSFLKIRDGYVISQTLSLLDHYNDILFYRDREDLLHHFESMGMAVDTVTLQRYNDRIMLVIGTPPENGRLSTSLWVEQGTFFPGKYVIDCPQGLLEVYYDDWQRVSRTWYPMQITVFLDKKLHLLMQSSEFELNSRFPVTVFDIEHMKDLYPLLDTTLTPPDPEPADMQDTLN